MDAPATGYDMAFRSVDGPPTFIPSATSAFQSRDTMPYVTEHPSRGVSRSPTISSPWPNVNHPWYGSPPQPKPILPSVDTRNRLQGSSFTGSPYTPPSGMTSPSPGLVENPYWHPRPQPSPFSESPNQPVSCIAKKILNTILTRIIIVFNIVLSIIPPTSPVLSSLHTLHQSSTGSAQACPPSLYP